MNGTVVESDSALVGDCTVHVNSIARGILLHDLMVKKADIRILQSHSICPGKYIVLIAGEVEPVQQSMREGLHYGGAAVVDSLLIENISTDIFPAMLGATCATGASSPCQTRLWRP